MSNFTAFNLFIRQALLFPLASPFLPPPEKVEKDYSYAGGTKVGTLEGGPDMQNMIVMWSGAIASIPEGWYLCDGDNGTPDLRDKFIVGAKEDDAGEAKTNVTGALTKSGDGQIPSHAHAGPSHTHTGPAHTHTVELYRADSDGGTVGKVGNTKNTSYRGTNDTGSSGTGNTGASGTGDTGTAGTGTKNIAVYFALAFIMKA